MKNNFLNKRKKRINNDVWIELSFELSRLQYVVKNEDTSHKTILNDLCTKSFESSEIRTGSGSSLHIIAETKVPTTRDESISVSVL